MTQTKPHHTPSQLFPPFPIEKHSGLYEICEMPWTKSFQQVALSSVRGLSRIEAAAYVGLGVTFFDQKVREGVLPKPLKIGKRKLWDRRELDAAFDKLKGSVQNLGANPWDP